MALWALTGETLKWLMRFVAERPDVLNFFRHTKMPDETFFQTVLLSSSLAGTVNNEQLHYLDWSAGSAHPGTLTAADLPQLRASGMLFARKFDADVDSEILDLLDEELAQCLLRRSSSPAATARASRRRRRCGRSRWSRSASGRSSGTS